MVSSSWEPEGLLRGLGETGYKVHIGNSENILIDCDDEHNFANILNTLNCTIEIGVFYAL